MWQSHQEPKFKQISKLVLLLHAQLGQPPLDGEACPAGAIKNSYLHVKPRYSLLEGGQQREGWAKAEAET